MRRLPLIHVSNCADAFVLAAEKSDVVKSTFNVVDSDAIRAWRFARDHQKASGEKRCLIPLPYHLGLGIAYLATAAASLALGAKYRLPTVLSSLRYRALFRGLRFPNDRLRQQLGWNPRLSYAAGLRHSHSADTMITKLSNELSGGGP